MLDPRPNSTHAIKVLVIDGEDLIVRSAGTLLRKHDFEVISVGMGGDALAILDVIQPDVILLDVILQDMSGFELCQKLHQNQKNRDVPVIFISEKADKDFVTAAFTAGGADYLTVPFHESELISRVELHAGTRRSRHQLECVIREKNQLLEILAHDLKNPLGAIQFAVSMLRDMPDIPENARNELVHGMFDSTERAFEIISSFLDSQALIEHKQEISKRILSLDEHAIRAVSNFNHHCERKSITIDLLREGNIDVLGESRLLMCCIQNLISNAIKFSPIGSRVVVWLNKEGEEGVIRIEDEGPGILEEEIPKLFCKFTRLSARPTLGEASTGLGLHVVHELMIAMNGSAAFQPTSEKGSIFKLSLPLGTSSK